MMRLAMMLMSQGQQKQGLPPFDPFTTPFTGLRNERTTLPPFEAPGQELARNQPPIPTASRQGEYGPGPGPGPAAAAAMPVAPPVTPPAEPQMADTANRTPTSVIDSVVAAEQQVRAAEEARKAQFLEMFPQFAGGSLTQQRGGMG